MKTYKVVQPEDNAIKKKLDSATTDIIVLLSEISTGADAIILPNDIYNSLIRHPGFSTVYTTQCYTCPFSECFLFTGKWWASENTVSPFLLAMSLIKENK